MGREGSRNEKMDRWEIMECKQSVRKLSDIQRDGGQERRRTVRTTAGPKNGRKDTRQWERQ
jgi:hypothetical protein